MPCGDKSSETQKRRYQFQHDGSLASFVLLSNKGREFLIGISSIQEERAPWRQMNLLNGFWPLRETLVVDGNGLKTSRDAGKFHPCMDNV